MSRLSCSKRRGGRKRATGSEESRVGLGRKRRTAQRECVGRERWTGCSFSVGRMDKTTRPERQRKNEKQNANVTCFLSAGRVPKQLWRHRRQEREKKKKGRRGRLGKAGKSTVRTSYEMHAEWRSEVGMVWGCVGHAWGPGVREAATAPRGICRSAPAPEIKSGLDSGLVLIQHARTGILFGHDVPDSVVGRRCHDPPFYHLRYWMRTAASPA